MGSLALRPGDSLTIQQMALSVGFRNLSFLPSCYSSYKGFDFYPGGTHLPLITPAFAGHTLFHSLLHAGLSRRTQCLSVATYV
jgi:hypothetical protein